jgi:two-component system sensor histidine kinase/response regulator
MVPRNDTVMQQPPPKVLVIDDNAENRALAQATLDDEGYAVILAANGADGLRAVESERPDCVLLDVRMPGMDGFAVCARIRELPSGSDVPVVFLTALRDVDTFDRALRAGGDDFLSKPVRPTELVVRVQAALRLRKLSGELRETYELVRRQRDDLMRMQLQKERLMSFVVHDLKNPVNSMDMHAQVLLRDVALSPRVHDSAQHIRDAARSLLRMVLNLLDISRGEEGQLLARKVPVDLPALVSEVIDAITVRASANGVRITSQIETPQLAADPDLLRRVLENLLDNALRHAPPQTEISVRALADEQGTQIRIRDAGSGVLPELREKIFDRFLQADTGERLITRTGRGLGLSFCKLAVEAHGGEIWVEEAQPGAVFCVRLPSG